MGNSASKPNRVWRGILRCVVYLCLLGPIVLVILPSVCSDLRVPFLLMEDIRGRYEITFRTPHGEGSWIMLGFPPSEAEHAVVDGRIQVFCDDRPVYDVLLTPRGLRPTNWLDHVGVAGHLFLPEVQTADGRRPLVRLLPDHRYRAAVDVRADTRLATSLWLLCLVSRWTDSSSAVAVIHPQVTALPTTLPTTQPVTNR